ncbi:hypothetical protein Glove_13g170 [Diversispora epigaea]|uniref:ARS-binding protein 1 N-terminal domain-containing protein n=1 Tax=Diversispora epigaea TaxID=1348612 RepID=A0A397JRW5_9GLOM|nr:hypothetical protein Glove_13g170 [Diversispora epigaea]
MSSSRNSRNKCQEITESQRTTIYKKKDENLGMTQTDIQKWTEQEFGFKVNQSTISRILKRPAEFLEETNKVLRITTKFNPIPSIEKEIYNMDETGLFYRLAADRSLQLNN